MCVNATNFSSRDIYRPATFVIPFYGDQERSVNYLCQAIESLFAQTDQNWVAVVVDDGSPDGPSKEYLLSLEKNTQKIKILWQRVNRGPGLCRNIAIHWAFERQSPIVLFQDSDDISHPDRLKVTREIFAEYPTVDLVYSGFRAIDENNHFVPPECITPSILEILEAIAKNPPEGYNAWIKIGTEAGFVCLPSATAVRTSIAHQCPFPDVRASGDSYTWMSIAASGNEFKFTPLVPSFYRVRTHEAGASQRARLGRKNYYQEKARVDTDGFLHAMTIALTRGTLSPEHTQELKTKFFQRLAKTLIREEEFELAEQILQKHHLSRD